MKKILAAICVLVFSQMLYAGRVVKHNHKCPGFFKRMDICVNYTMPDVIQIGETVPFNVEFYTYESSKTDERVYVDIESFGTLDGELMMDHSNDSHMKMPIEFKKIETGRYAIGGATFTMHGAWGMNIDLYRPNEPLIKRANLYLYIYPDKE